MEHELLKIYRRPGLSIPGHEALFAWVTTHVNPGISSLETEVCFYIETTALLTPAESQILFWLVSETFEPELVQTETSFLSGAALLLEVGPRMNFQTAFSSNAVSICHSIGLTKITRIERSRRFSLAGVDLTTAEKDIFLKHIHDRMTEVLYTAPLTSFGSNSKPKTTVTIPIMKEGKRALQKLNEENGFGFDDWDLEYYTNLFQTQLGRDPTDVECFDLAQSNSEHSRHWFFGGQLILDGVPMEHTLFQMVKQTLTDDAKRTSVIAFHDNSSVIQGFDIQTLVPTTIGAASAMQLSKPVSSHLLLTAETHNFPTGVAPYAGAETGTGGRIRDVQATGRGAHVMAGISAYSVGNLHIPDYALPWEDKDEAYPTASLASPLEIELEASNGASAYGNKFGEPVVTGFTRSFGLRLPCGERREYIKPIMFSAGVGQLLASHCDKGEPDVGLWVVKVGGPAYRIGLGGGAASSRVTDSSSDASHLAELDFNAVQRGDAEMENKMNRVIRACIELGDANPIVSIHDQGAGGNGNVLKEIVQHSTSSSLGGATYNVKEFTIGDSSLSILEIWVAEYQENNALLIKNEHLSLFRRICEREKSPFCALGTVTGDGVVVLFDPESDSSSRPVNLPLSLVLADMPQKKFTDVTIDVLRTPLCVPTGTTVVSALDRVLRLLSVASKRFLTTKVDRSVTGLIVQQQCVGPLHIPLADVAVVAQSHFGTSGIATACGEQPIKGLVNAAAMARLSVGEALTNLVWANVSDMNQIKCSANWMWAAKKPGEAVQMYSACAAMRDILLSLGVSIDGGKDSLSMSATVNKENVKSPGTLVITMYAPVPDITKVITPDLKPDVGDSVLLYVDLGAGFHRLGGTALAQVYSQIGDQVPDVTDVTVLRSAFLAAQKCISQNLILAGHDRSDGGIVTTLLEMAFAGNCGVEIDFKGGNAGQEDPLSLLFSEELGLLLQVSVEHAVKVQDIFHVFHVPCENIGSVLRNDPSIRVRVQGTLVLDESMVHLRNVWEATGFQLERLQCNPKCVAEEECSVSTRSSPAWQLTFEPIRTPAEFFAGDTKHKVAILREEGSNGDREMHAAFYAAGFECWDVTMTDLVNGTICLADFRGLAFVGGFSYADVLGSAKGWAGVAKFHPKVLQQLQRFKERDNTFSLGICNGCQLMALLGWVNPSTDTLEKDTPRFIENVSGRFESRFVSVKIQKSNSVLLKGMEGSSLGVWVAHGEGRFYNPKTNDVGMMTNIPLTYVDDANVVTERYPFNPNGSPNGIAGLTSKDGRHLCMMPHPERCFLQWQWPWAPNSWKQHKASPWLMMFQNAKKFCLKMDS